MQLTEQQFYLLLILGPALLTAIIVYALGAFSRHRMIQKYQQQLALKSPAMKPASI